MNVVLWILQVALALQSVAGGSYKVVKFENIANAPATAALSRGGWSAVGIFEVACGVLLVLPAAFGWPLLTAVGAAALAIESLALAAVYAKYSRALTAQNPLTYVVASAIVATVIAIGRFALAA